MGSAWMRSRWDRRIAGICGGIAQNQGWNSTVIRLLWVCLVLFGGTGILAYLVLWVVLPEEPAALPPYAGYAPPIYPAGYGQAPHGVPPHSPGVPPVYSNVPPGAPGYSGPAAYPGAPAAGPTPHGTQAAPYPTSDPASGEPRG